MQQGRNSMEKMFLVGMLLTTIFCTFILPEKKAFSAEQHPPRASETAAPEFATKEELNGKPIGVLSGSVYDRITNREFPQSTHEYFPTVADAILALKSNRIVSFMCDVPVAIEIIGKNPGLTMQKKYIENSSYGYGVNKDKEYLLRIINEGLAQLKADGTQEKLKAIWFGNDESKKILPEQKIENPKGTIKVMSFTDCPPLSYMKNDHPVGYEAAMLFLILNKAGYRVEITGATLDSIVASVATGKGDMLYGSVTITPEREKQVFFSTPSYNGGLVMVVRNKNYVAPQVSWWDSVKDSFTSTFIIENRYIAFFNGLKVTLLISLGAFFFGTILGFGLWLLQETKKKILIIPIRFLVSIMEGTPVPVLLMIFFYLVFGNYQINPVLVGILAFSLNFAVYVSEILTSSITSVDKGQWEAAKAMGFTQTAAFTKIILPQALTSIIPVYIAEGISMIKMTSVAGYITIVDLTKASDIIRSRTFEPFFPLIVTALIYILIAVLVTHLLSLLGNKFNPQKRSRTLKGVQTI